MAKFVGFLLVCVLQSLYCNAQLDLSAAQKSLDGIFDEWSSQPPKVVEYFAPYLQKIRAGFDEVSDRLKKELASNEVSLKGVTEATEQYNDMITKFKDAALTIANRRKEVLVDQPAIRDTVVNSWNSVVSEIDKAIATKQGDCQKKIHESLDDAGKKIVDKITQCAKNVESSLPLIPAEIMGMRSMLVTVTKNTILFTQKCPYEVDSPHCFSSSTVIKEALESLDYMVKKYTSDNSPVIDFARMSLAKCTNNKLKDFADTAAKTGASC